MSVMKTMINDNPYKIFIFIALLFGIVFSLVTPPFQVPDEVAHFYRAFQISELHILLDTSSKGNAYLPISLETTWSTSLNGSENFYKRKKINIQNIISLLNIPLNSMNRKFTTTSSYSSPIPYIPQALGIASGRIFNLSPLLLMYTGRIFNLIAWIFLISLAIKTTPVHKWVFFLLALTPMSLFQGASLSPDAVTNGLSFLVIALFYKYAFDKSNTIKNREILILILTCYSLSLCKNAYIFIIFLFLLIPVRKIGDKKTFFTKFFSLILSSFTIMLIWNYISEVTFTSTKIEISPERQMDFILSNLLQYCKVFFDTLVINGFFIKDFIGILGYRDVILPEPLIKSYAIILLLIALVDSKKDITIYIKQKIIIITIFIITIIEISTIFYLIWTPVGGDIILGIQGRYFIPLGPLFYILFYNNLIIVKLNSLNIITLLKKYSLFSLLIILYSTYSLTTTINVLITRYYNIEQTIYSDRYLKMIIKKNDLYLNLIKNDDFSLWNNSSNSAPDSWILGGGGTGNIKKIITKPDNTSAQISHISGDNAGLYQDFTVEHYRNNRYYLKCRVYSNKPASTWIGIYYINDDGMKWVESKRCTGNGEWEYLSIHGIIPQNTNTIRVVLWVKDHATVYYDKAIFNVIIKPISEPALYYLDTINNISIDKLNKPLIIPSEDNIIIKGWAVDNKVMDIAGGICIVIDGTMYTAAYGIDRPDVAKAFNVSKYRYSGFEAIIPYSEIGKGKHKLSIKILTNNKKNYYNTEPIIFYLK